MNFALYHEAAPRAANEQAGAMSNVDGDANGNGNVDVDAVADADAQARKRALEGGDVPSSGRARVDSADAMPVDSGGGAAVEHDPDADIDDKLPSSMTQATAVDDDDDDDDNGGVYVSDERREAFATLAQRAFDDAQASSLDIVTLLSAVNEQREAARALLFTRAEAEFVLRRMDEEGTVMMSEGQVFLV